MQDFYTFVDRQTFYPFGIKNMNVSDERIEWLLRLKGGVFLGDADNDPAHHSLPSMRKAKNREGIDLKEEQISLMI